MRCFRTSCSQQGSNQDTYNDILSSLEGADVVGVMHVIHLLQDGRHAGKIVALPQRRALLVKRFHSKISFKELPLKHFFDTFNYTWQLLMSLSLIFMSLSRTYFSCDITAYLTMRGEDLSMLMTVRLTLRRSRSIIS